VRRASALASVLVLAIAVRHAAGAPDSATDDAPADPAALARQVQELTQKLAEHPEDVDTRLALAYRLAWTGHRGDARREAREVLDRAPEYAEAYQLLAQLAAWDHDYAGARAWLDALAARQPLDETQLLLRATTYLWEGRPADARAVLETIHPTGFDVELLRARAEVELADLRTWRAHALAREILDRDPADAQAQQIFGDTRHVLAGVETYLGWYPVDLPAQRLATGVAATLVVFPLARFSVTAEYEYDYRFATHNHRPSLRADWRPTTTLTATVFARAGWVTVVPVVTAYGAVRWDPAAGSYVTGRYTYDDMPWPGQLHRLALEVGHDLPARLHVDASASAGLLDYCGTWQAIWGADAGISYVRPHWQVGVKLAHYTELDRPPLPAFLAGMYGANVCPADLGTDADTLDLSSVSATDAAIISSVQLDRRDTLSASYTYEHIGRLDVNTVGLAIRRSF
jgi:tetratricopeptide (TPR) repeat protein